MTILVVVDKKETLDGLTALLAEISPDAKILPFTDSPKALACARKEKVDVAFLDMMLPELGGADLGQYLQDLYPFINLVFLTDECADAFDAMLLRASGCILMPLQKASVELEMKELRHPQQDENKRRVFAQTFGNFEFFVDGKPIVFKYSRTKEILALLINNRGAQTSNGEIIASLWEDDGDPDKKISYLSNLRQDLQNTFTKLGLVDLLVKQRGSMAIAADRIECDFYDWLERKEHSRYQYLGDYMNQYSWAEVTHGELDDLRFSME